MSVVTAILLIPLFPPALQVVMYWHIRNHRVKVTLSSWGSRMQISAMTTSMIESTPWRSKGPASGSSTSTSTLKAPQSFWTLRFTAHRTSSTGKEAPFRLHGLFHQMTRVRWLSLKDQTTQAECWCCTRLRKTHSTATITSTTEQRVPSSLEQLHGPCIFMEILMVTRLLSSVDTTPLSLLQ